MRFSKRQNFDVVIPEDRELCDFCIHATDEGCVFGNCREYIVTECQDFESNTLTKEEIAEEKADRDFEEARDRRAWGE